jgi:DeoR family myo-inositol catabolism operon transcriptional repressor
MKPIENTEIPMKNNRLQDIENYIVNKQSVTLKELSSHFGICMNTVRKYVDELAKKPYIVKMYGGVRLDNSACIFYSDHDRTVASPDGKDRIARLAASYIEENDIVFIDSGTTTKQIPHYIPDSLHCTVITHSCHIIEACVPRSNITLITLPGVFYSRTYSFVDISSTEYLKNLNFRKAFMSSTGFSLENGATNSAPLECFIKSTASEYAQQVFLLADHKKIGVSSLLTHIPTERIHYLLTDEEVPNAYRQAFLKNGNQVVVADTAL